MSDYKAIHGVKIRDYTTDPDNLIEGQVWFDKTNKVLQFQEKGAGAFSSGGNLNQARSDLCSWGTQTAALIAGGGPADQPGEGVRTEKYNGTSWTEVNDMNTGKASCRGIGTVNTAGLCIGGYGLEAASYALYALVESFNGTSWTETTDMNEVRNQGTGAGSITSGLAFGGAQATAKTAKTEVWNGSGWTEVGDMNSARAHMTGFGVSSGSAIGCMEGTAVNAITELWNGTAWTEVNDLNTARRQGGGGFGIATAGLAFGGENSGAASVTNAESWNGTSWTAENALSTAVRAVGAAGYGGNDSGLAAGGIAGGGQSNATQEWNNPVLAVKTVDID